MRQTTKADHEFCCSQNTRAKKCYLQSNFEMYVILNRQMNNLKLSNNKTIAHLARSAFNIFCAFSMSIMFTVHASPDSTGK